MANSLNYNSVDLSSYGLIVTHSDIGDFSQQYDSQLIQDISYGFKPKRLPKMIWLEVIILAANRTTLNGYLDSIKNAIVTEDASMLKLDTITDRYWKAKMTTFGGGYIAAGMWQGTMVFQADNPMAYDNNEVSNDHNIDTAPSTTITETPGGTGYINPVYTLTAGEVLTDITLKVENLTTDEELQWVGSIGNGKELEIDVANWLVKNDGIEAMSTVSGKFPRLAPGVANQIKVTAFSTTGSLNIKYRNRYL